MVQFISNMSCSDRVHAFATIDFFFPLLLARKEGYIQTLGQG